MFQQSFSVGGERELRLQLSGGGDLHLIGVDETYLRAQGDGDADEYQADYQNGTLTLSLENDCALFVPRTMNLVLRGVVGKLHASELSGSLTMEGCEENAAFKGTTGAVRIGEVGGNLRVLEAGSLSAGEVHGDATIADVAEDAVLDHVAGDLTLRAIHTVRVGTAGGDVRASDISGDISAGRVNGDVKLESIGGAVAIDEVHGDARLVEIAGSIASLSAHGDLYLDGALAAGKDHAFSAGGDAVLVLPPDTNATLVCTAGGDVVNRFAAEKRRSNGTAQIVLGEGIAKVSVRAGGDIKIKPREGETMEFRIEINKEEMKRVKDEMKRAKEEMKRIKREIREQVRRAGHEAGRAGEEVHRARHEIHRVIHQASGGRVQFDFTPPIPPIPPVPPAPPRSGRGIRFGFGFGGRRSDEQRPMADASESRQRPSEEERLEILKMLEKQSITPEQAEMLLSALGDE